MTLSAELMNSVRACATIAEEASIPVKNLLKLIFVGSALLTSAAVAAEMTGFISDASCGAGNASAKAESRECAERCIKNGAAPVFVSDGDQKVYQISNADSTKNFLKGKVKVSGTVTGDKIQIAKIVDVK
jgi:hypothetical protein